MAVTLVSGERASGVARTTSNLKALEYFWRAEKDFIRHTKESEASARDLIGKAIELDPEFSSAWAMLGATHSNPDVLPSCE